MKTRRSGSRSGWPSNQPWRCFRTSGRSCSIAWPVFFYASCRGARRTGRAPPQRHAGRLRSAPGAAPQARCPCAPPRSRGCLTTALQPGVNAYPRPEPWAKTCPSPGAAAASGSPSMGQRQTAPLPPDNSSRYQSPTKAANADPSIKAGPSVLASFTGTDSESEIWPDGNPQRFITVENRSSARDDLALARHDIDDRGCRT